MKVTKIASASELQQCSASWNCLTRGVPLRGWEWLSTWWDHYGAGRELHVLAVHDELGTLLGMLPLFREQNATRGRVLQLLGSGKVCTDYVTVLSTNEHEDLVTQAIAEWLIDACSRGANDSDLWDLLELDGTLTTDSAMAKLVGMLSEAGCGVHRKTGLNCWKAPLPASWDEMYAGFSKNRRRGIRRLQREAIDNGRVTFATATSESEFLSTLDLLVDLHQKRRVSLGDAGCFASETFENFIRDASAKLFATNQLELAWLELDGRPVAVEYNLINADTTYAYQGGIEPTAAADSPGHLLTLLSIRHSIQCGRSAYDFLRGDEPYKSHWGSKPQATVRLRISANRTAAHLRQGVWLAGATMKNLVKGGLTLTGMQ